MNIRAMLAHSKSNPILYPFFCIQAFQRVDWSIKRLVVLATYAQLQDQAKTSEPLAAITWRGLFLDEAHTI